MQSMQLELWLKFYSQTYFKVKKMQCSLQSAVFKREISNSENKVWYKQKGKEESKSGLLVWVWKGRRKGWKGKKDGGRIFEETNGQSYSKKG